MRPILGSHCGSHGEQHEHGSSSHVEAAMHGDSLIAKRDYWVMVPLAATMNAKPGSSPLPGVVVF